MAPISTASTGSHSADGEPSTATTRGAVLRLLLAAERPLDVVGIATAVAVHPNAVRRHLAALVAAGLAEESREARTRPGRPRLLYEASATAIERWSERSPYEHLALLLLELAATGDDPREVGRRAGRAVSIAGRAGALASLLGALTRQGFAPRVGSARAEGAGDGGEGDRDDDRVIDVVLQRCPFAHAAAVDPSIVCAIHLGLAEGMLEGDAAMRVGELHVADPASGGCRLELRRRRV